MNYGTSSLGHFLPFLARELKTRPAVTYHFGYRTFRYSYRDMFLHVRKTSVFLLEKGVVKGDRILVYAGNCPQYAALLLSCGATGIVLVPVDANSGRDFADRISKATSPKLIFTDKPELLDKAGSEAVDIDRLFDLSSGCDPSMIDRYDCFIGGDDVFEIVYTSGTTQEPKGVVITQRNIVSNLRSLRLRLRYNPSWKFLSMLPLSHLFEQMTGCLAPLRFGCEVVYTKRKRFSETTRIIRECGITSIVAVPAVLSLFKSKFEDAAAERGKSAGLRRTLALLSRFPFAARRAAAFSLRRAIGSRFDFFVCGGGPLNIDVEGFWENIGIKVVQGYGLTEASPIVTCNSYETRVMGSVGRVLKEQTLRIDTDGEILIAGENVIREYYKRADLQPEYFRNGWYATGDIGRVDAKGNLFLTGRKKNMIVGPDGMNVYPEDIEAVLARIPGVRECVVFADDENGSLRLCAAVLFSADSADPDALKQQVNSVLNPSQRLSAVIRWPYESFPMTPTLKIRRADVAKEYAAFKKGASAATAAAPKTGADRIVSIISQLAHSAPGKVRKETRLCSELGFDSLKMTELAVLLENSLKRNVDETKFGSDPAVADIERIVSAPSEPERADKFPRRPSGLVSSLFRRHLFPLFRFFLNVIFGVKFKARGTSPEHPVIFVANHQSHLDTVAVLSSIPRRLRCRTAVASASDYFFERLNPGFLFMSVILNMFPFFRKDRFGQNLANIGSLIDAGMSVLIFPEGTRSRDGSMGRFRNGIGVIVREMKIPVVPVKIKNAFELLPCDRKRPARGTVETVLGGEMRFDTQDPEEITSALEKAVSELR